MKSITINLSKRGCIEHITFKNTGLRVSEENQALVESYEKPEICLYQYADLDPTDAIALGKWLEGSEKATVEVVLA